MNEKSDEKSPGEILPSSLLSQVQELSREERGALAALVRQQQAEKGEVDILPQFTEEAGRLLEPLLTKIGIEVADDGKLVVQGEAQKIRERILDILRGAEFARSAKTIQFTIRENPNSPVFALENLDQAGSQALRKKLDESGLPCCDSVELRKALGFDNPAKVEELLREVTSPTETRKHWIYFTKVKGEMRRVEREQALEAYQENQGNIMALEIFGTRREHQTDYVMAQGQVGDATDYTCQVFDGELAKEALKKSNEDYEKRFANSLYPKFIVDPVSFKILKVNPAACEMLNYSGNELLGESVNTIHPDPDEQERLTRFIGNIMRDNATGRSCEFTCTTRETEGQPSKRLRVDMSCTAIELAGKQAALVEVFDLTERIEREEKTLQMAELGMLILQIMHEVGNLVNIIKSESEMLRRYLKPLYIFQDLPELFKKIEGGVEEGVEELEQYWKQYLNIRVVKNNIDTKEWEEITEKVPKMITAFKDATDNRKNPIDELKSYWEQTIKKQCKKIIDQLTANPDQLAEFTISGIKSLEATSKRFKGLINDVKESSHEGKIEPTDICHCIQKALSRVYYEDNFKEAFFYKSGTVTLKVSDSKPIIIKGQDLKGGNLTAIFAKVTATASTMINPNQVNRVFLNLFTNAAYAVKGNEKAELSIKVQEEEKHIIIAVGDNGVGMAPETLKKAFEPRFTTKGEKGTGVGLFVCQKEIKKYGGKITADSTPGEGTTFTIRLPLAEEKFKSKGVT